MKFDPFLHPIFRDLLIESPFCLYDAGASGEVFSFFPLDDERSYIHAFEPVPESARELREKYASGENLEIHEVALADIAEKRKFHCYERAPGSSSLNANAILLPDGGLSPTVIDVNCETLKAFCEGDDIKQPDFLKMDTEGAEHSILVGADSVLDDQVLGVYSEIKFIPLSSEGTKFRDLNGLLEDKGFLFFDIQLSRMTRCEGSRVGGKKGAIESSNALYLRDYYRYYDSVLVHGPAKKAKAKLVKLLIVCVKYLYMDYALELVQYGMELDLLTAEEVFVLKNMFSSVTDIAWKVPDFPGKSTIALLADYLSYILQPRLKNSVPPMHNNLGNRRSAMLKRRPPDSVTLYYPVRCFSDRKMLSMKIDIPKNIEP